jgi:dephospho-CoA kinase
MMRIGLTGGIGSGKSRASAIFAAQRFSIRDTDQIFCEEILPDPHVISLAAARWGAKVRTPTGALDRKFLATLLFNDSTERSWWEKIVHPRINRIWRSAIAAAPTSDWVIEIPLLFENGLEKEFDFVACVAANYQLQLARITARGISQMQAEQRIAAQLPLVTKLNSAHFVLWNEGTPLFLEAQVSALITRLRGAESIRAR